MVKRVHRRELIEGAAARGRWRHPPRHRIIYASLFRAALYAGVHGTRTHEPRGSLVLRHVTHRGMEPSVLGFGRIAGT